MKKKVIFLSILFALLEIIFPVSSGVLGSLMHLEGSKMILLQALFMGASTILFFIIILKKVDRNGRFMGIKCLFKKKNLPLLLTFLLFLPLVLGQKTSSSALTIWASFGLYLMVGISEELVFRILIPSILGKEFKTKGIIVISTLLFGLGHASIAFGNQNAFEVILSIYNALVFGLLAICLLIIGKSIFPVMFLHFLFDFSTKIVDVSKNQICFDAIQGTILTLLSIFFLLWVLKKKISYPSRSEILESFWNSQYQGEMEGEVEKFITDPLFNDTVKKAIHEDSYVLDYGCGSGWALPEIYFTKKFSKGLGVDASINGIHLSKNVAELSKVPNLSYVLLDEAKWVEKTFDVIFSCNTLDVVSESVSQSMIALFNKVVKEEGIILLSLNPYLESRDMALTYNLSLGEKNHYYKDGVLRVLNLSNEEWIRRFLPFFECLDSFNYQIEGEKACRRMFVFKKIQ